MGALHEGHAQLVRMACAENDVVAVSIFVNPTQFNNQSDLLHYPRTPQADLLLLEEVGCDVLFIPEIADMYPEGFTEEALPVRLGGFDTVMEGAHRPGHFAGVMQVVNKLFHAVGPCQAYFGQKDMQQLAVVKHMVSELALPIKVIGCPIVREADGLAMSSRNRRLTPEERAVAGHIYKALQLAASLWPSTPPHEIEHQVAAFMASEPLFTLEYIELADTTTLQPLTEGQQKNAVACIAARLGVVRLIDNVVLG